MDCTSGNEEPLKNAVFKWVTNLDEGEGIKLFRREGVEEDIDVTLISKGRLNLWPKTWAGIRVNTTQYGRSLSVTYTHQEGWREGTGRFSLSQDSYEEVKFVCSWLELREVGEKEIYHGGVQRGRGGLFAGNDTTKLGLEISLNGTCYTSGKNKAECNLKVTTSKN